MGTASRNNPHNNTTEPSTLLHHQPTTSLNLEMKSVLGLVMLAAVVLIARAQNLDCGAGFFSNGDGCCPIFLNGSAYYPGDDGCYPIITDLGVQYSDEFGCYPDLDGFYEGVENCTNPCAPECFNTTQGASTPTPTPIVSTPAPSASSSPS